MTLPTRSLRYYIFRGTHAHKRSKKFFASEMRRYLRGSHLQALSVHFRLQAAHTHFFYRNFTLPEARTHGLSFSFFNVMVHGVQTASLLQPGFCVHTTDFVTKKPLSFDIKTIKRSLFFSVGLNGQTRHIKRKPLIFYEWMTSWHRDEKSHCYTFISTGVMSSCGNGVLTCVHGINYHLW